MGLDGLVVSVESGVWDCLAAFAADGETLCHGISVHYDAKGSYEVREIPAANKLGSLDPRTQTAFDPILPPVEYVLSHIYQLGVIRQTLVGEELGIVNTTSVHLRKSVLHCGCLPCSTPDMVL